jgi:hypothetical protein
VKMGLWPPRSSSTPSRAWQNDGEEQQCSDQLGEMSHRIPRWRRAVSWNRLNWVSDDRDHSTQQCHTEELQVARGISSGSLVCAGNDEIHRRRPKRHTRHNALEPRRTRCLH